MSTKTLLKLIGVLHMAGKEIKVTQNEIMEFLDKLYDNSIQGIPKISLSISQLAEDYMSKNKDTETAAKSFINHQLVKCTTSGFITGLGGLITLPVAISCKHQ